MCIFYHTCPLSSCRNASVLFLQPSSTFSLQSLSTCCSLVFYFIKSAQPCTMRTIVLILQIRKWNMGSIKFFPSRYSYSFTKVALQSRSLWWLILHSLYYRNLLVSSSTSVAVSLGAPPWMIYLGLSLFTCEDFSSGDLKVPTYSDTLHDSESLQWCSKWEHEWFCWGVYSKKWAGIDRKESLLLQK